MIIYSITYSIRQYIQKKLLCCYLEYATEISGEDSPNNFPYHNVEISSVLMLLLKIVNITNIYNTSIHTRLVLSVCFLFLFFNITSECALGI